MKLGITLGLFFLLITGGLPRLYWQGTPHGLSADQTNKDVGFLGETGDDSDADPSTVSHTVIFQPAALYFLLIDLPAGGPSRAQETYFPAELKIYQFTGSYLI
jgi:hypothetical protein